MLAEEETNSGVKCWPNIMSLKVSLKKVDESCTTSHDQLWKKEWGSFLCTDVERSPKYVIKWKKQQQQGVGLWMMYYFMC